MRVTCSLLVLAAACGGSPAAVAPVHPDPVAAPNAPSAPSAPPAGFDMTVGGSITAAATGATTPVVSAHELHTKDAMFFTVTATQRATVYVAYCDTSQQLSVYPPTGEIVAEPNVATRIPRGDSFIADSGVGQEHVFVIASAQPLAQGDPRLYDLIHSAQGASVACPPEVTAPPPSPIAAAPPAEPAPAPAPPAKPPSPIRGATAVASSAPRIPARLIARGFSVGDADISSPTRTRRSDANGIAIFSLDLSHE